MGEVSPEESARIAAERANQPFKLSSGDEQGTIGDLVAPKKAEAKPPADLAERIKDHLKENPNASLRDIGRAVGVQPHGYGDEGSPLDNPLNRAIVELRDKGEIVQPKKDWGQPTFSLAEKSSEPEPGQPILTPEEKSELLKPMEEPAGEMFRSAIKAKAEPSDEGIRDAAKWLQENGGSKDRTEAARKLKAEFGAGALRHATDVFKQARNRMRPSGSSPLPGMAARAAQRASRAISDAFGLETVPKLSRAGVGDEAVAHASAYVAAKHAVNDLLSRVFPDQYHDPEAMGKTMGVLVKDNILAGYDDYLEKEVQAAADGDTAAEKKYMEAAEAIDAKHDLTQYDEDVRAAMEDPKIAGNIERWKSIVNPELDALFNKMKGLDPNTEREGRGRHTQARLNLLAVDEKGQPLDMMGQPMEGPARPPNLALTGSTRNPAMRRDRFDRAAKFTGNYSTDADAILSEVMGRRLNETTKGDLYKKLEEKGVAVIPPDGTPGPRQIGGMPTKIQSIEVPETDPATGRTRMVKKNLFVRQDVFRELRSVLNTDLRTPEHPLLKAGTYSQIALSPVDAISHIKNLLSAVSGSQGAGSAWKDVVRRMPLLKSADAAVRVFHAWHEVFQDTPEIRSEMAGMAKQGLIRPDYELPMWKQMLQPGAKLIHAVDTGSRVVMNRFFDHLVDRGLAKDTIENRRNFVNQVGQYNRRLMGAWSQRMRDSGLSPFIVAGRNFNRQGRRALLGSPGFEAASTGQAIKARAIQLIGPTATILLPMMLNSLTTGKPSGRPGVPVGAWDTGKNDENGNPQYIDMMQLGGERRGMRSMGLDALASGLQQGKNANQISGNAVDDVLSTAMHPWLGPGMGMTAAAMTGRRLDLRGSMQANTIEEGGGKQKLENLRAAIEGQNPVLYGFLRPAFKKAGLDTEKDVGGIGESGSQVLKNIKGAIGVRSARKPSTAAEELAGQYAGRHFGDGVTTEEAALIDTKRQILNRMARADGGTKNQIASEAIKDGSLTRPQATSLLRKSSMSYLRWSLRSLDVDRVMKVWDEANDAERKEIRNDVLSKIMKSKSAKPEDRSKYWKSVKSFRPVEAGK